MLEQVGSMGAIIDFLCLFGDCMDIHCLDKWSYMSCGELLKTVMIIHKF